MIFRFESKDFISENQAWIRWLTMFVGLQFFLFSPFFVAFFDSRVPYWQAITIGTCIVLIFNAISLIIQPIILYGIKGWIIQPENGVLHSPQTENAPMIYISREKFKTINSHLEQLMTNQKPFLKPGYSLMDLTNDLNIPLYQVSFFLNHEKGKTFHDMLNEYRVEHSRGLMLKENNRQLTLEAIAFESGFGNRNSFTTAFKKFTGETPSAFMKAIKTGGLNGNGHGNGNGNGVHGGVADSKKNK
jgi:AraC-like DNA-binding protein